VSPLVSPLVSLVGLLAALSVTACGKSLDTRPATAPLTQVEGSLARAPALALRDANGREHTLASLTRGGAAVLVFYRGYW
jgi:hypothetical protein